MSKNFEIFDFTSEHKEYYCHYAFLFETAFLSWMLDAQGFDRFTSGFLQFSVVVMNRHRFHQPILITDVVFEVPVVAPANIMVYKTCNRHGSHAFDSTFDS